MTVTDQIGEESGLIAQWRASFDFLSIGVLQEGASHLAGRPEPKCVSGAKNDFEAVAWWLNSAKENTLVNYRKTIFRFAAWYYIHKRRPLSQMQFEDWAQYEGFLKTLPASWCSKHPASFGDFEGGYRYFKSKLAQSSIVQEKRIVSSLYSWLTKTGYCFGNPFSSDRRGENDIGQEEGLTAFLGHSKKAIEPAAFEAIRIFVEAMKTNNRLQEAKRARLRFILDCLYYSGLRVSELCELRTSARRFIPMSTGKAPPEDFTYLMIVYGKGRKFREVPMHQKAKISYLMFRDSISLPTSVKDYEDIPLLLDVTADSIQRRERAIKRASPDKSFKEHLKQDEELYCSIGRQAVYKILTKCYDAFRAWILSAEGQQACGIDESVAVRLAAQVDGKNVHSLRHSFGTNMVMQNGVNITSLLMGHTVPTTTMKYVSLGDSKSYDAISQID